MGHPDVPVVRPNRAWVKENLGPMDPRPVPGLEGPLPTNRPFASLYDNPCSRRTFRQAPFEGDVSRCPVRWRTPMAGSRALSPPASGSLRHA